MNWYSPPDLKLPRRTPIDEAEGVCRKRRAVWLPSSSGPSPGIRIGMRYKGLNLRRIRSFFVVGEQNIFSQLKRMVELALEANALMKSIVSAYGERSAFESSAQEIRLLEKQGDEISFWLRGEILKGAISPNVLDNLLEAAQVVDAILDDYYYLSRELNRMLNTEVGNGNVVPKTREASEFEELFQKLLEQSDAGLSALAKLLSSNDADEMIRLRKQIEEIEEAGDDMKDAGFDELYAIAPKLNYIQFTHYTELLHKLDDILDSCEDVSDLALSVITSISK